MGNVLSYECEINISPSKNEYIDKYLQYVLSPDSQDIVKNNYPRWNEEQINKYQCVLRNIDYKNPLNFNKNIRDGDTCIFYRLEAIRPQDYPSDGRRDVIRTNSDLKNIRITTAALLITKGKYSILIPNGVAFNRRIFEHSGPLK